MSVLVVTDASACLPPALVKEYGITVLDFHAEGEGEDETTAGLGALELTACYARLLERGGDDGVVALHVSKELSGTWSSAEQASAVLDDKVAVIDTRSAGMVIGQAAIAAARCAGDGGSLEECRDAAQHVIDSGQLWLFVNRLDTLARGGRLTAGQRLLSTALAIKPILHLAGGRLELAAKTRTRSKAMERMVTLAADGYREVSEKLLAEESEEASGSATSAEAAEDAAGATDAGDAAGAAETDGDEATGGDVVAADSTSGEVSDDVDGESVDSAEGKGDDAGKDGDARDTEEHDRPRIFNFGGKDKTDRTDKSDRAEKDGKGDKPEHERPRLRRKPDDRTPLDQLPRVPMHLAVHHRESEDAAEQLRTNLRAALPECVVISVVDVTDAMAVHTGPGALGISLVED